MAHEKQLLSIWGDSVDFRELIIGMVFGAIVGFISFYGGNKFIEASYPELSKGLQRGYSLLIGVGGCLLVGVITAKAFKPKRIFREDNLNIDEASVLRELGIDMEQEIAVLDTVPADVIKEMKDLGLYDLFYGSNPGKKEEVSNAG